MLLMACNAAARAVKVKLQSQEVRYMHALLDCLALTRQFLLHELHCVEDHDPAVCNTRSTDLSSPLNI